MASSVKRDCETGALEALARILSSSPSLVLASDRQGAISSSYLAYRLCLAIFMASISPINSNRREEGVWVDEILDDWAREGV